MRSNAFFMTHLFVAFFVFNGNAQQTIKNAKKEIAKSNEVYFQAFAKGDSSLFIDRYAKDCCIMPPNVPAICGREAPLSFFRMAYATGIRNGKFITTGVFGDGRGFVTEEGLFQLYDANAALLDSGKYLVLWKLTPDGWKMFRDSFSSNK
jgi:ketosteroid isomerase-like protein